MRALAGAAVLLTTGALAQEAQDRVRMLSLADVSVIIANIRKDPSKTTSFCTIARLSDEYVKADEGKDEQRVRELSERLEEASEKAGTEIETLLTSPVDEEAEQLIADLASSCQ